MNGQFNPTTSAVRSAFAVAALFATLSVGVFIEMLAHVAPPAQQVATTSVAARL
jgi:hypothetical protein